MNHFRSRVTSPLISICAGYGYMGVVAIALYSMGFYSKSSFFTWGTPITFMNVTIEDNTTYYSLLILFFGHQLFNNWINDVTYPWIINCVQDPKSNKVMYSDKISILIINMFSLYSELDMVLVISGVVSQVTFFLMIILANMISATFINSRYLSEKKLNRESNQESCNNVLVWREITDEV